ncbi:hypothetical protein ACLOJK_034836 [Asimina triloba]
MALCPQKKITVRTRLKGRHAHDVLQPLLPSSGDDTMRGKLPLEGPHAEEAPFIEGAPIETPITEALVVGLLWSSKKWGAPVAPLALALKKGHFIRLNKRDPDQALYFGGLRGGARGHSIFGGHVDSLAIAVLIDERYEETDAALLDDS